MDNDDCRKQHRLHYLHAVNWSGNGPQSQQEVLVHFDEPFVRGRYHRTLLDWQQHYRLGGLNGGDQ